MVKVQSQFFFFRFGSNAQYSTFYLLIFIFILTFPVELKHSDESHRMQTYCQNSITDDDEFTSEVQLTDAFWLLISTQ